jgi:hypothetical protein
MPLSITKAPAQTSYPRDHSRSFNFPIVNQPAVRPPASVGSKSSRSRQSTDSNGV